MNTMTLDDRAIALSYSFGQFRPSDRERLISELGTPKGETLFVSALFIYLEIWAKSDWLEYYTIERIGRWIAVSCSGSISEKIRKTAGAKHDPSIANDSIYNRTYQALIDGIKKASTSA